MNESTLPRAFLQRMQEMLKEEYPLFLKSYQETKNQALRLNPLKGKGGRFLDLSPFSLSPVPWEKNGYYYEEDQKPGRHPYHEAGVYYIQEASAMAPAALLAALPGERVLDLCASPGGKSTQIAAAMEGRGLLICNEIHPARAKILSENIERMGVCNAVVINHSPHVLAEHFHGFFDKILVDAPCSGEGMFRKNEEAVREWSPENVRMCAKRQDEILDDAAGMLRAGGRLVYSTCTFAPEENEGSISRFLKNHPEFSLLQAEKLPGISSGNPDWIDEPAKGLENAVRLWPHRLKGEGHFAACLQKEGEADGEKRRSRQGFEKGILEKECPEYMAFREEYLRKELPGVLVRFGEQLYLVPEETPSLDRLKVLRPGLHLGALKKGRFEPAHALALALKPKEVLQSVDLIQQKVQVEKYLSGQTFQTDIKAGWCLICVDGYSIGWGKAAGGTMKNHYPKGLRKNW